MIKYSEKETTFGEKQVWFRSKEMSNASDSFEKRAAQFLV